MTPNETELAALTGGGEVRDADDVRRRAAQLLARGAARVLVKWGARGAALFDHREEHWWPAHQVPVVDTTAAGDAFNGAFAVALANGAAAGRRRTVRHRRRPRSPSHARRPAAMPAARTSSAVRRVLMRSNGAVQETSASLCGWSP